MMNFFMRIVFFFFFAATMSRKCFSGVQDIPAICPTCNMQSKLARSHQDTYDKA